MFIEGTALVATSIYHQVFINKKDDIKLRYVYIISCSSTVISYPYLMSTKWKARSGQIRFVHVIASKECERGSKSAYVKKFSKWQPCFDVIYNKFDTAVKLSVTKRRYKKSFSMYKKVDIKLHNVYINYHVFIYRKVDIRLRRKYLSSRVHRTKNDIKLQHEYINTCSSAGKLKKRCTMYILQRLHLKEN